MCGGFSCLACSRSKVDNSKLTNAFGYNLGRLISYIIIVNLITYSDISLKNLSLISSLSGYLLLSIIIFQFLLLIGLGSFLEKMGYFNRINRVSTFLFGKAINKVATDANFRNTLTLGALTTLIPCGWLYLNLGLASAQPTLLKANLIVLAFWLGTVPALSLIGLGSMSLANKFKGRPKLLAYIIVLLLSLYSLSKHFPEFSSRIGLDDAICHIIKPEVSE
jgi:sulfite exporter TauE/SafE